MSLPIRSPACSAWIWAAAACHNPCSERARQRCCGKKWLTRSPWDWVGGPTSAAASLKQHAMVNEERQKMPSDRRPSRPAVDHVGRLVVSTAEARAAMRATASISSMKMCRGVLRPALRRCGRGLRPRPQTSQQIPAADGKERYVRLAGHGPRQRSRPFPEGPPAALPWECARPASGTLPLWRRYSMISLFPLPRSLKRRKKKTRRKAYC